MKKCVLTWILLIATLAMEGQVGSPVYNKLVSKKSHTSVTWDGHGYLVDEPICLGEDEDGEEIWVPFQKYYNADGEELFDAANYFYIEYIPEGDIFIYESGGYGIARSDGEPIVDPWVGEGYDDIRCLISENGNKRWISQFKVKRGGYAGVLDTTFKEILSPNKYTDAEFDFDRQLFIVEQDGKGGVLDKKGKELIMFPHTGYISVSVIKTDGSGWFIFVEDTGNKQYLCSYNGQLLWTAEDYKLIENEDLMAVKIESLWGYIDVNTGEMVIPTQYTSAEPFSDGVAKVSKGNDSFLISNPLKNGGKSKVVSSLSVNTKGDIDVDIPVVRRVQENKFVVIIANQDYQEFSVPYAQNDGLVFKEYCLKTLGVPKTNVMYYENATLNTIKSAIARLKDLADVYEGEAEILFYYSGQGVCDEKGNPYLLPTDGIVKMATTTGLPVSLLYSDLGNLDTQSSTILLDASFNNKDREGNPIVNGVIDAAKAINPSIIGKMTVFTASNLGETAWSYPEKSHGVFTYFLCKKIRESNGNVNLKDLSDYLSSQIPQVTGLLRGKKQNPQTKYTSGIQLQYVKL